MEKKKGGIPVSYVLRPIPEKDVPSNDYIIIFRNRSTVVRKRKKGITSFYRSLVRAESKGKMG